MAGCRVDGLESLPAWVCTRSKHGHGHHRAGLAGDVVLAGRDQPRGMASVARLFAHGEHRHVYPLAVDPALSCAFCLVLAGVAPKPPPLERVCAGIGGIDAALSAYA